MFSNHSNLNSNIIKPTFDPNYIWEYDLSSISEQFAIENPEFSNEITAIENEYRHFIYLLANSDLCLALKASDEVDEYWHVHILNTPEYVKFCDEVAGEYIHHARSIISNPLEQAANTLEKFQNLNLLSLQEFGKQVFKFRKHSTEKTIVSGSLKPSFTKVIISGSLKV